MSYERHTSMNRLEQQRARYIARIEAFERALEAGQTTRVVSGKPSETSAVSNTASKAITNRLNNA